MSDKNSVGLISARGFCEAMRRRGIPSGSSTETLAPGYAWCVADSENRVWECYTYNERMDIKDWDRLSGFHRSEVPLRHQPLEVQRARILERDQAAPGGRSRK
jgi:hypothetical protein